MLNILKSLNDGVINNPTTPVDNSEKNTVIGIVVVVAICIIAIIIGNIVERRKRNRK